MIFNESEYARYYFQIRSGIVELNNFFEDGKEFVHGFPFEGHCFSETYLLTEKPYVINAVALSDCDIIKLEKESYKALSEHLPELFMNVSRYTAERLHFRYLISSFLAIKDPEIKIYKLLKHLKEYFGYDEPFSFQVPFTQSQLAFLVGLRVETVIRALKKMESSGSLKINYNKILY